MIILFGVRDKRLFSFGLKNTLGQARVDGKSKKDGPLLPGPLSSVGNIHKARENSNIITFSVFSGENKKIIIIIGGIFWCAAGERLLGDDRTRRVRLG